MLRHKRKKIGASDRKSYYNCMEETQAQRIRAELKAVGVGMVGLHTPESKALAKLLHADEHIHGVVYGRYTDSLSWLVATDQRVLFVDRKPLYSTTDELSYDTVTGVKMTRAGLFVSVVLHTKIDNYSVRFVSPKCANIFVKYIESRRLESSETTPSAAPTPPPPNPEPLSAEAQQFLVTHDLGVLSTVDRTGTVQGAIVYYYVMPQNLVYILTKSGTGKGRNVYAHSQVALTVHEPGTLQTLQLQGMAQIETNQNTKNELFAQMIQPRVYKDGVHSPPVTKLHEGSFTIIRITPTRAMFHDYAKAS